MGPFLSHSPVSCSYHASSDKLPTGLWRMTHKARCHRKLRFVNSITSPSVMAVFSARLHFRHCCLCNLNVVFFISVKNGVWTMQSQKQKWVNCCFLALTINKHLKICRAAQLQFFKSTLALLLEKRFFHVLNIWSNQNFMCNSHL